MGILGSHVPTIAMLKPGVVEVITGKESKKFFASGGFAVMNADSTLNINVVEAFPLDYFDTDVSFLQWFQFLSILSFEAYLSRKSTRPFELDFKIAAKWLILPLTLPRRPRPRSNLKFMPLLPRPLTSPKKTSG